MKRDTSIPYVELEVQLHGCVPKGKLAGVIEAIKSDLVKLLKPDFTGDIEVTLQDAARDLE